MSSLIVNLTLYFLVILSMGTWTIIVWKTLLLRKKKQQDSTFLKSFWAAKSWSDAEQLAQKVEGDFSQLAKTSFIEMKSFTKSPEALMYRGGIEDVLERQLGQELQNIQKVNEWGMTELATVGSSAPFIGLFGTVWGIKNALHDISSSGQAGIDVVAGPIGEALIATAIGIAVALPAVLAYNFFLRRLSLRANELQNFSADLVRLSLSEKA